MRLALVLGIVSLLLLAACSPSTRAPIGSGVATTVLNMAELNDIYVPMGQTSNPSQADLPSVDKGPNQIEAFRIATFVHNTGFADSLVAMYITGYDPNLFEVVPIGPYVSQDETRYCYHTAYLQDGDLRGDTDYVLSRYCSTAQDVFYGVSVSGSDGDPLTGVQVGAYTDNINRWLRNSESNFMRETGRFLDRYGLNLNPSINCEIYEPGSGRDQLDGGCQISLGLAQYFTQRSSRGQLALALYGGLVRDCANGCVLIPSPRLPNDYLAGNTERYPGGEGVYVDFAVLLDRSRWPANLNDHSQLFQISTCSLYTTYATPDVCIDPTPGRSDAEVCRPGTIRINQDLPAPLRITHIEQSSQGPRVQFTIHVQNSLGGRIFHPGAIDFCSPASPDTVSRSLLGKAHVVDARVLGSLTPLDCSNGGEIRLVDGRGRITCTHELSPDLISRSAFQTTLNIEIAYLYRDIQTIQANIHKI